MNITPSLSRRLDTQRYNYIHVAAQRRSRGACIDELVSAEVAESRLKLLAEVVLTIGWCTAAKTLCIGAKTLYDASWLRNATVDCRNKGRQVQPHYHASYYEKGEKRRLWTERLLWCGQPRG